MIWLKIFELILFALHDYLAHQIDSNLALLQYNAKHVASHHQNQWRQSSAPYGIIMSELI